MTRENGNCMTCIYAHMKAKWVTQECIKCREEQKQKEEKQVQRDESSY